MVKNSPQFGEFVLRSGPPGQAYLHPFLVKSHLQQSPFAPFPLRNFITTMGFSDSPSMPLYRLWFPGERYKSTSWGLPGSWNIFQYAPSSTTPESPVSAFACYFLTGVRLQDLRDTGQLSTWRNEAESGSLALRLALSSHKASQAGLPRTTLNRLHDKQAIVKVDSFQSTRYSRLCLAHPRNAEKKMVNNET
jgi:hypothetical protein